LGFASAAADVLIGFRAFASQVCALLSGGGYADKVVVPAGQLLPIPEGVSLTDAAGLPEVAHRLVNGIHDQSPLPR